MTDLTAQVLATVRDLHRKIDDRDARLDEKLDAKFGRVHTRLDEMQERVIHVEHGTSRDLSELRHSVKGANEAITALANKIKDEIVPETNDFKRMKMIGVGATGLLAIGGLSILGMLAYAGEAAAVVVRRWLGFDS